MLEFVIDPIFQKNDLIRKIGVIADSGFKNYKSIKEFVGFFKSETTKQKTIMSFSTRDSCQIEVLGTVTGL